MTVKYVIMFTSTPELDDAIALVKTWPSLQLPGIAVEIRPMVTDYSQFE